MKQILLMLFVSVIGFSAIRAKGGDVLPFGGWIEIKCEIMKENVGAKSRSLFMPPRLFQSNANIVILSSGIDCNARVVISDMCGTVVKDGVIQVIAGQVCPYYIGDLLSGEYEVTFETDELVMTGDFDI